MLWDVASRKPVAEIGTASVRLRRLTFAPDGLTLAAVDTNGAIRFWDVLTRYELPAIPPPPNSAQVNALTFAPDGSCLVVCAHDGSVRLLRAE